MLSLPLIAPRPDASLWPSHHTPYNHDDTTSTSPPNQAQANRRPTSHHGHGSHHHHHSRTPHSHLLTLLSADENTIEQRKLNVRRFGSNWIRPPGIPKTLQAIKDEELEKEEQEQMARREQVMLDLAAAQQDAANAEARQQGEIDEEMGVEASGMERDLDDDVPDADAEDEEEEEGMQSASEASAPSSVTDSDVEEESEIPEGDTTVPFNEDSFIEGSMLEAEVSHMLEMEEAEIAGVLQDERDLDDDVPEAGSYEHTDSELEDESDADTTGRSFAPLMSSVRSRREMRRESGRGGRRVSRRREGFAASVVSVQAGHVSHSSAAGVGVGVGGSGSSRGVLDFGADLGQGRSSFGLDGSSSIMEGSSFLRSSPVTSAPRGNLRDRFLGIARGGARRG